VVDEAECVDGALTRPTITVPDTPGITYSYNPPSPWTQGQTVVVTAKLADSGVAWDLPLPEGWVYVDPVTATYTVTFAQVSCTPATPLDPGVVQATCADGEVTEPTITPQETAGVTYVLDPEGPYEGDGVVHGDGDGDVGRRL
jgi:hypothetical protein